MLGVSWWVLTAVVLLAIMYDMNRKRTQANRVYALLMVCGVVGLLLFTGQYDKFHESVVKPLFMGTYGSESSKLRFGIMFDAGSTGSRIHAFRFKVISEDKPLVFEDEYFEQLKPGLSSYADNPKAAAHSLVPLLEGAKLYIPGKYWDSTPIALKATAGLRLLPGDQANAILKEVKKLFQEYPFKVTDNSISIMEGTDEGLFSWFTVNYYIGALENPPKSYPVMDLGGGSTQITFIPGSKDTLNTSPKEYITEMDVFHEPYKVYTHSYLGLGLMSGRLQTMGGKEESSETYPDILKSVCFPAGYETKWKHGGKEYTIQGEDSAGSRSDACQQTAKSVFSNVHQPAEIKSREFTVISYYFDRAEQAGLVQSMEGGTVTVQDYVNAANKACQVTSPAKDNEFLCLDLSYISALLVDGFGFPKSTRLHVKKRINGNEISWALGAMFQMMPGGRAANRPPGSKADTSITKPSGTLPVTLLTGHSFIENLDDYLTSKYRRIEPSKVFNVTQLTKIKIRGFSGVKTHGFLNKFMNDLPNADLVVLDIGCNDIASKVDPKVAAGYAADIIRKFLSEYGARYVVACKATFRVPPIRMRYLTMEKCNENIQKFNEFLEEEISKIPLASIHEHREVLELSNSEWTVDGLHPKGLGMVRYMQSIRRAIVTAHTMASKVL